VIHGGTGVPPGIATGIIVDEVLHTIDGGHLPLAIVKPPMIVLPPKRSMNIGHHILRASDLALTISVLPDEMEHDLGILHLMQVHLDDENLLIGAKSEVDQDDGLLYPAHEHQVIHEVLTNDGGKLTRKTDEETQIPILAQLVQAMFHVFHPLSHIKSAEDHTFSLVIEICRFDNFPHETLVCVLRSSTLLYMMMIMDFISLSSIIRLPGIALLHTEMERVILMDINYE
jgi:hypothetical protein